MTTEELFAPYHSLLNREASALYAAQVAAVYDWSPELVREINARHRRLLMIGEAIGLEIEFEKPRLRVQAVGRPHMMEAA